MRTSRKLFAVLIVAVATVPGMVWAQGKGNDKAQAKQNDQSVGDKVRDVLPASEAVFATKEITLIQSYFKTNLSSLPPGLAKRETLPPDRSTLADWNGAAGAAEALRACRSAAVV